MEIRLTGKSQRICGIIAGFLHTITAVALGIMMMLVTIEAVLRYAFKASIYIELDATEIGMVLIAFLPVAYILLLGRHVRM